jgi:hypothetical protein
MATIVGRYRGIGRKLVFFVDYWSAPQFCPRATVAR